MQKFSGALWAALVGIVHDCYYFITLIKPQTNFVLQNKHHAITIKVVCETIYSMKSLLKSSKKVSLNYPFKFDLQFKPTCINS